MRTEGSMSLKSTTSWKSYGPKIMPLSILKLRTYHLYSPTSTTTSPKPTSASFSSLPQHIQYLILWNISTTILVSCIRNVSRSFRTLADKIVTDRKDMHLERIRALQSFVPAAILPNEILQEIFRNLAPIDFYAATRVCESWRLAGEYESLLQEKVQEASRICYDGPKFLGEPVSGGDVGDRETLIRYLQRGKSSRRKLEHTVSTIYFSRSPNSRSDVRAEPAIGAGEGTKVGGNGAGQNIFLDPKGRFFLSSETASPHQTNLYCTYRPVLPGDPRPSELRYSLGAARSGKSLQPDSWDLSPTHIMQFPECAFAGKVISVDFSSASVGGIYWDPKEKSYTKGVDVLVLHQRRAAHFYKVRAIPGSKPPSKKGVLAQKLLGCDMKASLDKSQRWHVWGSLSFSSLCKNEPGDITVANIGNQGRTLAFGCSTGIEIFEGIDQVDSFGNWKTDFITRRWVEIPWATMCLPLQTILTGRLWHSEMGTDVDYLICSTKEHAGDKKKKRTKKWGGRHDEKFTSITMPADKLNTFSNALRHLTQIQGVRGAPQFLGIKTDGTVGVFTLCPRSGIEDSWEMNAWGERAYKPFVLMPAVEKLCPPSTTSSLITSMAGMCFPDYSAFPYGGQNRLIAIAYADGSVFVYEGKSIHGRKLATVPGVVDLKFDCRVSVLGRPKRETLWGDGMEVRGNLEGVIVTLIVATDRGRVEVCRFDTEGKRRKWDVCGQRVYARN